MVVEWLVCLLVGLVIGWLVSRGWLVWFGFGVEWLVGLVDWLVWFLLVASFGFVGWFRSLLGWLLGLFSLFDWLLGLVDKFR